MKELHAPPGNRFEELKGNRAGQYSIRINDQWRICFEWALQVSYDLEVAERELIERLIQKRTNDIETIVIQE